MFWFKKKKMVTTEKWTWTDRTGGSAYNSKPQKMPSFARRTLGELPPNAQENVTTGKQQEEDFAHVLRACNPPEFGRVVDNLWISGRVIHMPRKRV